MCTYNYTVEKRNMKMKEILRHKYYRNSFDDRPVM